MPKLTLDVKELTNPELNFVSLVKRGANRIPFKIVKEDPAEMLDLDKIGRRLFSKEQAPTAPTVTAALVRKGADLEQIKARLTAAGLSVEDMVEKGELLVFNQPGGTTAEDAVIKLDDDLALAVSGLTKAFEGYNFDDTEFGKVLATKVIAAEASSEASPKPVLLVIANQDFYYKEYSETRASLEAAGLDVVVAAATTETATQRASSVAGIREPTVDPDVALGGVNAADYSAIVFVGGWGASSYQYAFETW